jgi:beta-glucosidase
VDAEEDLVPDPKRLYYFRRHLTTGHRALSRGVNQRSHFVWSLLTNFEWGYGYAKRFGIVRVDFDTLERTVKDSGAWYARLARTGTIPQ